MTKEIPLTAERIVNEFMAEITKLKAHFITGMYLTGSIALNDFHPNKSDIDFLILCNELPKADFRLGLEQVHRRMEYKFKNTALSGCYITPDSLNVYQSQTTKTLCFHEGRMNESSFEMAPVTLYELKTTAITLLGIPAQELPITIELKDVHTFLLQNINTYWKAWIAKHSSFIRQGLPLVLIPRLSEWAILGVGRQLYTLKTEKIASKTDAGYYCLEHLPDTYHPVIQEAIKIRNDTGHHFPNIKPPYYVQPSLRRARETVACVHHIIQLFNEEYKEKKNSS
jgi:predicted nucleotidyltransferase